MRYIVLHLPTELLKFIDWWETTKETVDYTFYWFDGATVADTSLAVFKGPVRNGLAAGTYSIVAYHKGLKCGSTSAQVVVGQQTRTLVAAITWKINLIPIVRTPMES